MVPLNALLRERGKKSVGAGNAIAVQNLGENSAMLLMLDCTAGGAGWRSGSGDRCTALAVLFALAIAAL